MIEVKVRPHLKHLLFARDTDYLRILDTSACCDVDRFTVKKHFFFKLMLSNSNGVGKCRLCVLENVRS